jgi:hypothetical protein
MGDASPDYLTSGIQIDSFLISGRKKEVEQNSRNYQPGG